MNTTKSVFFASLLVFVMGGAGARADEKLQSRYEMLREMDEKLYQTVDSIYTSDVDRLINRITDQLFYERMETYGDLFKIGFSGEVVAGAKKYPFWK